MAFLEGGAMSLLRQIPFLTLHGPEFLNFYGLVAVGVLISAYLALRLSDRTGQRPPPSRPDAIEIAYLAGGVNNVVRTLLYDLYQRGYVSFDGAEGVAPSRKAPAPGELNAMARRVLEGARAKPIINELFQNPAMRRDMEAMCAPYAARLRDEQLLRPASFERARFWVRLFGVVTLLGLAGAKIAVDWSIGKHNIGFLVMLSLFAAASLLVMVSYFSRHHASRRGRAYLEAMRLAFSGRLTGTLGKPRAPPADGSDDVRAFEGASLFLIGLYGLDALNGTPDQMFATALRRGAGGGDGGGDGGDDGGG
jgi:uncharacterized protein (TIGR04222 family)